MQGMFKGNGGCGYVKKPDCLLRDGTGNQVFDPNSKLPVKTTLKVSNELPFICYFSWHVKLVITITISWTKFNPSRTVSNLPHDEVPDLFSTM